MIFLVNLGFEWTFLDLTLTFYQCELVGCIDLLTMKRLKGINLTEFLGHLRCTYINNLWAFKMYQNFVGCTELNTTEYYLI